MKNETLFKEKNIKISRFPQIWLHLFLIILLTLGIFFRLTNLDHKVYWYDEAFTSLRVSGFTEKEMVQQLFNGRVIEVELLQKFQNINSVRGLDDSIKSLATEEPQHAPLYFILARLWAGAFGSSVAAIRSLSALLSLLVFPCLYWLCIELFESNLTAWVAVALIAISPFHVLYSQEARPYGLWTVTILISSAALLRAMQDKKMTSWIIYTLTVSLGLYTFMFSLLTILGYGVYVWASEKFRLSKQFITYLLATLAGFITFIPWLFVIFINQSSIKTATSWTEQTEKVSVLVMSWANNLSRVFVDFNFSRVANNLDFGTDKPFTYIVAFMILPLFAVVSYSFYFLCRHAPTRIWLFILTLVGITGMSLILPDLLLGRRLSTGARYAIPCYLGIQLAIAYLLSIKITDLSAGKRRGKLWRLVLVLFSLIGVISCSLSSQAEVWWNKYFDSYAPQAAQIINQSKDPLVISDRNLRGYVMALSHRLDPKVKLLLTIESVYPSIPTGYQNIFLYWPSQELRNNLQKLYAYKLEPIHNLPKLWRLKKQ